MNFIIFIALIIIIYNFMGEKMFTFKGVLITIGLGVLAYIGGVFTPVFTDIARKRFSPEKYHDTIPKRIYIDTCANKTQIDLYKKQIEIEELKLKRDFKNDYDLKHPKI